MKHTLLTFVVVSCLLSLLSADGLGQSLNQIREDARAPKPPKSDDDRRRRNSQHDHDDHYHWHDDHHHHDDDDDESLFANLFFFAATSPFWAPRAIVGDDSFDSAEFARYPYLHSVDGYLSTPLGEPVDDSYPWMLRARAEYLSDGDALSRAGGQVLFDTACRLGVDSEFNYHREIFSGGTPDSLWTGDVNFVYRFAQSQKIQMRTGLGVNWLSDTFGTETGFNFTYSGDLFPRDPWIVSMEIDWGKIGAATLFHGRVTAGVQFHRFEVYTGYDYLDIGTTEISSIIGGIRIWY